jgi:hypothetical protein
VYFPRLVLLSPAGFHKDMPLLIRALTTTLAAFLAPTGYCMPRCTLSPGLNFTLIAYAQQWAISNSL